jgi:hypothetical protein
MPKNSLIRPDRQPVVMKLDTEHDLGKQKNHTDFGLEIEAA